MRVNLPLPLVKVFLESGMSISGVSGDRVGGLNIDWQAIVNMVDQGVVGKLAEIEDNGDHIEIVVE